MTIYVIGGHGDHGSHDVPSPRAFTDLHIAERRRDELSQHHPDVAFMITTDDDSHIEVTIYYESYDDEDHYDCESIFEVPEYFEGGFETIEEVIVLRLNEGEKAADRLLRRRLKPLDADIRDVDWYWV